MARSSSPAADVPCVDPRRRAGDADAAAAPTDRPEDPAAGRRRAVRRPPAALAGARRASDDVVIAIGHLGELIEDFVGDGAALRRSTCRYSHDGPTPLGTGGALRRAVDAGALQPARSSCCTATPTSTSTSATSSRRYRALGLPAPDGRVPRTTSALDASNAAFDGRLVRYEKGVADPVAAGLDLIDYGLSVFDADVVRRRVPGRARRSISPTSRRRCRATVELGGLRGDRAVLRDRLTGRAGRARGAPRPREPLGRPWHVGDQLPAEPARACGPARTAGRTRCMAHRPRRRVARPWRRRSAACHGAMTTSL